MLVAQFLDPLRGRCPATSPKFALRKDVGAFCSQDGVPGATAKVRCVGYVRGMWNTRSVTVRSASSVRCARCARREA